MALRQPSMARWQRTAAPLDLARHVGMDAAEHVGEHPVAHAPRLQLVDLDGHRVADAVDIPGQGQVEGPEEALDRVAEELDQVTQREVVVGSRAGHRRGQRLEEERRRGRPRPERDLRSGQHLLVEGERRRDAEPAGLDVAAVVTLERVVHHDLLLDRCRRGAVECVEQLAEWHGRRPRLPAVRVGAGVGDDQPLGGRADRVEQQLAVLGAHVSLAGDRSAREDVVAVDGALPREDAVVEAEQADDPVRHRAHRHHRADGQAAGPEVGAGRASGEVVVEERPDVGEPQRAGTALPRVDLDPGQLALHLTDLPLVGAVHLRQRGHAARQRVEPVGQRPGAGEQVGRSHEPVDVLGEPAGQLDPVAPDVVEREGGAEPGLRVVGHGHAGQHPVEPEPPGVLEVADTERRAVVGVEPPPDARLAHPVGHGVEVVVDEAEAAPDRLGLREVEHRAGGGAAAGDVEELGRDSQQRVGARQRAVGELDPEPVRRVAALDDVTETERRGDQRRVVLDVRTHHQDVARLERALAGSVIAGAVLEQPEQHLAEDLHLPGRAVAAVHLHRPVGRVEGAALRSRGVVSQVGLEPAEQRVGRRGRRHDLVVVGGRAEAALELALVAAERGEQRVPDPAVADVVACGAPGRRGRPAAARGRRWGGAATGAGRDGWPGRGAARSRWPASGCARTARSRGGRSLGPARSRSSVAVCRWCGCGAATVSARARHSGGCQARSPSSGPPSPSVASPADQSTSSCGRCAAYDANRPASRRATA